MRGLNLNRRLTSPDPLLASGHAARPQSWNRYSYVLNNPLRYVDPSGLFDVPTDGQQPQPQPQQQTQPTPATGEITITPEQVGLQFTTQCEGSPDVPMSPQANNLLVTGTAQMATNIARFLVAAYELEQSPETSVQTSESTSVSLTLQVGTSPTGPTAAAGASAGDTTTRTVTAQTAGPLAVQTRVANSTITWNLGDSLANVQSPVACNNQPVALGQVRSGNADNVAVDAANVARSRANDLAEKAYRQHFPHQTLPKAYDRTMFSLWDSKRF